MAEAGPAARAPGVWGSVADALAACVTILAIAWALGVQRELGLGLYPQQFLAAMLALTLPVAFLTLPARAGAPRDRVPWWDVALAAASAAAYAYVALRLSAPGADDLRQAGRGLAAGPRRRPADAGGAAACHRLGARRHRRGVPRLRARGRSRAGAAPGPGAGLADAGGLHGGRLQRDPRPADVGRGDGGRGLHLLRRAAGHHGRLALLHRRRDAGDGGVSAAAR